MIEVRRKANLTYLGGIHDRGLFYRLLLIPISHEAILFDSNAAISRVSRSLATLAIAGFTGVELEFAVLLMTAADLAVDLPV